MSKALEIHPLCAIFPDLNEAEFDGMVASMKAAGNWKHQDPIYTYKGAILDGKNRQRAAEKAKIVPQYIEWQPTSEKPALIEVELRAFVISKNLTRRHLDESQRAMIAASLANLKDGQRKYAAAAGPPIGGPAVSQSDAAGLLNVSERSVQRAATVIADAIDPVKEAVLDQTVNVSDAANIADLPPKVQNAALKSVRKGKSKTLTAAAYEVAMETIRAVSSKAAGDIESGRLKLSKATVIAIATSDDVAKALRAARLGEDEQPKPKPKVVRDDAGKEIPEKLLPVFEFRDMFDSVLKGHAPRIGEAALILRRELKQPEFSDVSEMVKKIHAIFTKHRPRVVCQGCLGSRCTRCKGRGWK